MEEGQRTLQHLVHPNADGYRAVARAVTCRSTANEEPEEELVRLPKPPQSEPLGVSTPPDQTIDLEVANPGSKRCGERFWDTAGGFALGSDSRLRVRSRPTVLAGTQAVAEGLINSAASLPAELVPGVHRLDAVAHDDNSSAVAVAREIHFRSQLPGWLLPVWIAVGVLEAVGFAASVGVWRNLRRQQIDDRVK